MILGQKDPLEKGMATHSDSQPGEFHGQRSLEGYSPGGCKELYTNERLILAQKELGKEAWLNPHLTPSWAISVKPAGTSVEHTPDNATVVV